MRTDYEMIHELCFWKNFKPAKRHVISMNEIYEVNSSLELDGRNELSLRNLRNTVVMYFEITKTDDDNMFDYMDLLSAITSVIDSKLANIGAEV